MPTKSTLAVEVVDVKTAATAEAPVWEFLFNVGLSHARAAELGEQGVLLGRPLFPHFFPHGGRLSLVAQGRWWWRWLVKRRHDIRRVLDSGSLES